MKKNDLIIIVVGLLIALGVYGVLGINTMMQEEKQKIVEIYMDGELQESHLLTKDGIYHYESSLGYNVVTIEGGAAWISEANCPTLSCIDEGAIDGVNESVVCLPHHFHIKISGVGEVEVDGISQ